MIHSRWFFFAVAAVFGAVWVHVLTVPRVSVEHGGARLTLVHHERKIPERPPVCYTVSLLSLDKLKDGKISFAEAFIAATTDGGMNEAPPRSSQKSIIRFDSKLSGTIDLNGGHFAINNNDELEIYGNGKITLDAKGLSNIFTVSKGKLLLDGLTLTGGNAEHGGAIYSNANTNTQVILSNCTLTENTAKGNGGAVQNNGCLLVYRSIFHGNTAMSGGAIENGNGGEVLIQHCTFVNNTAVTDGGGIKNNSGHLILYNSIVIGNSAQTDNDICNASRLRYIGKTLSSFDFNPFKDEGNVKFTGKADEVFLNAAKGDFRLKPESAAVKNGISATAAPLDKEESGVPVEQRFNNLLKKLHQPKMNENPRQPPQILIQEEEEKEEEEELWLE
jgi:hypothetical protein